MKNQKLLTSVAALCAAMYVTTSFAQEAGMSADAEVAAETGTDGTGAAQEGAADTGDKLGSVIEETAPTGREVTFDMLISNLESGEASVDLSAVDETTAIEAVRVSEMQGEAAENSQALDDALMENQDQIIALQDAVATNADISALLETEGLAAETVITVMSDNEESVQIVVDDRDGS